MSKLLAKEDQDVLVSSKRAADQIVAELEARIISGKLKNGDPLPPERDLMEEFECSRTVIREAIGILSNRGLVQSRPRFRPVVRQPDFDTIFDNTDSIIRHMLTYGGGVKSLYDSRKFIERGLVRDAATSATKEDIANLKAALNENEKSIWDSWEFYKTDMAFHRVLYDARKNPVFTAVGKAYASWLWPHWEKMNRRPERNEGNFIAHRKIYTAILERDPDAAEQALTAHLDKAWQDVRGTFDPPHS